MALTTLVGTKWRFDKPATFSSVTSSTSEVYEIVGTLSTEKGGLTATSSLGTIYRYFRTSRPSGVTSSYIAWVNFTSSGGGTTSYSFTMAMESNAHPYPSINGQNRFSTYGYVTLEITGGSGATNTDLITWLQTNATRVTETKLVNATELDENLADIANAIRTKGGTSSPLTFPSGFVSAVEAIPTGGGGTKYPAFVGVDTSTYNSTLTVITTYSTQTSNSFYTDEDGNAFDGTNGAFEYKIDSGNWVRLSAGTLTISPGSGYHDVVFRFVNTNNNKPFGGMQSSGIMDLTVGLMITNNSTARAFYPAFSTRDNQTGDESSLGIYTKDIQEMGTSTTNYQFQWQISGEED